MYNSCTVSHEDFNVETDEKVYKNINTLKDPFFLLLHDVISRKLCIIYQYFSLPIKRPDEHTTRLQIQPITAGLVIRHLFG